MRLSFSTPSGTSIPAGRFPVPRASRLVFGLGIARTFFGASALLAGLTTAACGTTEKGPGRALEVVVATDADTLNPRYATDPVAMRVTRLVHAGLVRLEPRSLAPIPYLAKSWAWTDARTLRVELRDDVRFHSGAAFSARDVVATIQAFQSKEVHSRHAQVVDAIASAEADGDHAVVVRLARAHATLLTNLELPVLRANQAMSAPDPSGARLDGLGPYAIASVVPGAIALTPADDGALPRPAHAVTVRTVHDENARAMRLYAGRADVAVNQVSPTLLPAMSGAPGVEVQARPGSNLSYLVVRHGKPPLDDPRVRRAISHAVDRSTITQALLAGYATPAEGLVAKLHWAAAGEAATATMKEELAFDPEAARRELAEIGGKVRVTLLCSTERLRVSIARTLAQELADVGIEAEVVPLERGTLFARLDAGDFDLAALLLPEMTEPHVFRYFLHSAFAPPNGGNRGRIQDLELDRLLEQGGEEQDLPTRQALYERAALRVVESMDMIPLWHEDQVAVTSERARAFSPSAEGRWLSLAAVP